MDFTNGLELLQITGVTTFSLVVYSSGYPQNLLNDFLFCILPQYYAIIYPDRIWDLYLCLAMLLDYNRLRSSKPKTKNRNTVIDYLRFTISAIVVIAIYAVDFRMFEKRLEKSDFFGMSLMDVGVGSFIYNGGVMGYRNSPGKYLRSCPVLITLGFIRYFVVKACNLEVNPREYGLHLNFYFLLTFVNFIYCTIKSKHNFFVGLCVITCYEVLLTATDLGYAILSDNRRSFLEQNKEGFVAVISYISIFLMSTEMGKICFSDDTQRRKTLKAFILTIFFGSLYILFSLSTESSRRIGNGAFVFWVLMLHSFHIAIYMLFESLFELYNIQISRFCSSNMMFVFLFSNVIVLLGNVSANLKAFSLLAAHAHLLSYLLVVFVIPALLTSRFNLGGLGLRYKF